MVKTPTWSRRLPRVRYLPSMASGHSPCMTRSILGAERVAVDRVRVEEIPNVQRGWFADALCKRQIARQGQRKQLAACTERGPFSLYIRAYWADKPRSRQSLPACSREHVADVRFWHKADISTRSINVRFWG